MKPRRRKYLTAAEKKEMVGEKQEKEGRMWSVPSNTNKNVCQLQFYNSLRVFSSFSSSFSSYYRAIFFFLSKYFLISHLLLFYITILLSLHDHIYVSYLNIPMVLYKEITKEVRCHRRLNFVKSMNFFRSHEILNFALIFLFWKLFDKEFSWWVCMCVILIRIILLSFSHDSIPQSLIIL
jgi:hypothetical protein